ncbi:MAG: hypothetical protein M0Q47_04920 [Methanothrix sp.]|jgi:hypothetical protein|uniref:hypothetical protein n=1 Tax=Methanothrix sp. TaxID=90426 RepID=UPI0025F24BF2|nr:hypothetical protein [Methanothrix sp.]MCK9405734.1 hypothetical protein [Methanothrix sp.]
MFKLGEYYEEEATRVANYLRDAGFKVDVKGLVTAQSEFVAFLQGKASELRERGKISDKHEKFISAMKTVLEKASNDEELRDLYLTELDPDWRTKRDRMNEKDLEEADEKTRDEIFESLAYSIVAMDFAKDLYNLNNLKVGEPAGDRLDDPVANIYIKPQEADPEDPLLNERLEVDLEKMYVVSIDESSSALFRDIDEDFQENYYQEYQLITALGLVVEDLLECPEKGKMDIEDFAERCILDVGSRFTMSVDASLVAEEIARSLEKRGMLKIKGNTIKWKA